MQWVATRAEAVHCGMNRANLASIDLHEALGLERLTEGFAYPRAGLTPEASLAYVMAFNWPASPTC